MKFNNVARLTAALLLSLVACLGFTACSRDYTVGFLYVLSTRAGNDGGGSIGEYGIDYQTGALLTIASSGQPTQGRNPVGIVVSHNQMMHTCMSPSPIERQLPPQTAALVASKSTR